MSKRGLSGEASAAVREPLLALGFRKRAGDIYTLEVANNVVGWLGLSSAFYQASRREDDVTAINPVVGVRHYEVEHLVADLQGHSFHQYTPATVSTPLGYLTPDARYLRFKFSRNMPLRGPALDLAKTVETYGIPFMRATTTLDDLLRLIEADFAPTRQQLAYRRPVVLLLMGDRAAALRALERELAAVGDREDPASVNLRVFAERFHQHAG